MNAIAVFCCLVAAVVADPKVYFKEEFTGLYLLRFQVFYTLTVSPGDDIFCMLEVWTEPQVACPW